MQKVILVTGATSGFGKAIATKFASKGYSVVITGRRADRLAALQQELQDLYKTTVVTSCFDVCDRQAVTQAIQEIMTQVPHIDILVNNAGLASGLSSIDQGDIDDWEVMIDTNVKGLLYVSRQILPYMTARAKGHVFNIGSTAAKTVYKNGNVYCATKFAVDALNQSMRIDLLPYGIKVTGVHPGMAETEFSVVRFKGDEERAKNVYADLHPIKPEDIGDIVYYCASLPAHLCINDLTVTCLTQATSFYTIKEQDRILPKGE